MKYKRICRWCGKKFETDDVELDHCSIECFHAEEEYDGKQRDIEYLIETGQL